SARTWPRMVALVLCASAGPAPSASALASAATSNLRTGLVLMFVPSNGEMENGATLFSPLPRAPPPRLGACGLPAARFTDHQLRDHDLRRAGRGACGFRAVGAGLDLLEQARERALAEGRDTHPHRRQLRYHDEPRQTVLDA